MKAVTSLPVQSYKEVLSFELEKRLKKNPHYSLRSFAEKLKLPASALSEILNGKRGLSRMRAEKISKILEMNSLEAEYFVSMVDASHARSKRVRELAYVRAQRCRAIYENPLLEDHFKAISDWWHFAILELCWTRGFQSCPVWISKKLGLSITTTKDAVKRLQRLKILKKSGEKLQPTADWLTTFTHDMPSAAVRKFHKDLMQKAFLAVDGQEVHKRNLSSLIFAIDASNDQKLQELKNLIMDFNRKLNKIATTSDQQTHLYCFTTQLFSLES